MKYIIYSAVSMVAIFAGPAFAHYPSIGIVGADINAVIEVNASNALFTNKTFDEAGSDLSATETASLSASALNGSYRRSMSSIRSAAYQVVGISSNVTHYLASFRTEVGALSLASRFRR